MSYNFLIIGGDKRISILASKILKEGYNVYTYANETEKIEEIDYIQNIKKYDYDIVISAMPLTKDNNTVYTPLSNKKITLEELKEISNNKILIAGKIPSDLKNDDCDVIDEIKKQKNRVYDILEDEPTTILNTIPTAEGAIQIAMEETNYTLNGKKALILGYGKVGKTLANKLSKIGMQVYCEARKESDLMWIKVYGYNGVPLEEMKNYLCKMHIIFNTIPTKILDKNKLILIRKNTLIIDLASAPGGVDYDSAKKLGIKAILATALPGKVAPDTCAEYLLEFVNKVIK